MLIFLAALAVLVSKTNTAQAPLPVYCITRTTCGQVKRFTPMLRTTMQHTTNAEKPGIFARLFHFRAPHKWPVVRYFDPGRYSTSGQSHASCAGAFHSSHFGLLRARSRPTRNSKSPASRGAFGVSSLDLSDGQNEKKRSRNSSHVPSRPGNKEPAVTPINVNSRIMRSRSPSGRSITWRNCFFEAASLSAI